MPERLKKSRRMPSRVFRFVMMSCPTRGSMLMY
jgi:hypothetical protein